MMRLKSCTKPQIFCSRLMLPSSESSYQCPKPDMTGSVIMCPSSMVEGANAQYEGSVRVCFACSRAFGLQEYHLHPYEILHGLVGPLTHLVNHDKDTDHDFSLLFLIFEIFD